MQGAIPLLTNVLFIHHQLFCVKGLYKLAIV